MKQKGFSPLFILLLVLVLGLVGFFVYKMYWPGLQKPTASPSITPTVAPTASPIPKATPTPVVEKSNEPDVTSPKTGAKVTSPLTATGTVPSGWMFEGSFPIKLVDHNRNLIDQGTANEVVPGSWQSGSPAKFSATLTFTTSEHSGFLILMNDNPSGDPSNELSFEVPVTF